MTNIFSRFPWFFSFLLSENVKGANHVCSRFVATFGPYKHATNFKKCSFLIVVMTTITNSKFVQVCSNINAFSFFVLLSPAKRDEKNRHKQKRVFEMPFVAKMRFQNQKTIFHLVLWRWMDMSFWMKQALSILQQNISLTLSEEYQRSSLCYQTRWNRFSSSSQLDVGLLLIQGSALMSKGSMPFWKSCTEEIRIIEASFQCIIVYMMVRIDLDIYTKIQDKRNSQCALNLWQADTTRVQNLFDVFLRLSLSRVFWMRRL